MSKRKTVVERPMLMSAAADPPAPAEVAQPAPAEVARPASTEWAPTNDKEFVDFFLYLLKAPLILFPGWEDTFQERMKDVRLQRMIHYREIFTQKMCTEYEAMLYVSSATLVHPPSHDWYVIYMYLFRRWRPDAADSLELDASEGTKLNPNQQEDLDRLRLWVFKHQMLHLKGQTKAAKEQEAQKLEVERPKLF
ncbi:MAG: hypothetical protein Q8O40_11130 [Chloroflexota bacterium]|nr:hypothetical protein [Chloroflexota bacterium]